MSYSTRIKILNADWTLEATPVAAADHLALATVTSQTVTSTTFRVEAVAENYDPTDTITTGPLVSLNGAPVGNMTREMMIYKTGTDTSNATESTPIWFLDVTLPSTEDTLHEITVSTTTQSLSLDVKYKSALTVVTVANATELRTAIQASLTGAGTDTDRIEIEYAHIEPADSTTSTLNKVGESTGSQLPNTRNSWLYIALGTGGSWRQEVTTGATALATDCDMLCWDGLTFGSSTDDWKGGGISAAVYPVDSSRAAPQMWFKGCTWIGWMGPAAFGASLSTLDTYSQTYDGAGSLSSFCPASTNTAGQTTRRFATDSLHDGAVSTVRFSNFELVRDSIADHCRGDYVNGEGVYLNNTEYGYPAMYKSDDGSGIFHNDLYQMFNSLDGVYFGGCKVVGGLTRDGAAGLPHNGQKALSDSTQLTGEWYENFVIRDIDITGIAYGIGFTNLQWSGRQRNGCWRGIFNPGQQSSYRTDTAPTATRNYLFFGPNVHISDITCGSTYVATPYESGGSGASWNTPQDLSTTLMDVFVANDTAGTLNGVPASITNYILDLTITINDPGTVPFGTGLTKSPADNIDSIDEIIPMNTSARYTNVLPTGSGDVVGGYPRTGGQSTSFDGFINQGNSMSSRYWSSTATVPPYIAMWDQTAQVWIGWAAGTSNGTANATASYNTPTSGYLAGLNGHDFVVLCLNEEPLNFSDWTRYP
jgi:hypothetical protein